MLLRRYLFFIVGCLHTLPVVVNPLPFLLHPHHPMISLIIPHCPSEKHDALLERCIKSFGEQSIFEIIPVVNEINTIGFTKAVNLGLRVARGEYLAVVNNDVQWLSGALSDLCVPRVVTSPKLTNRWGDTSSQYFWGCFFVLPRKVYEAVGPLDEQFYLYCSDTDYVMRVKAAGFECQSVTSCDIFTEGGMTVKDMPERNRHDIEDHEKFLAKWGVNADQVI